MRLELTEAQASELREILQSYLGDLRMEVAQTDSMDYRERLKEREVLIKDLLQRLRGAAGG